MRSRSTSDPNIAGDSARRHPRLRSAREVSRVRTWGIRAVLSAGIVAVMLLPCGCGSKPAAVSGQAPAAPAQSPEVSGGSWTQQGSASMGANTWLNAVCFADGEHGWAVGFKDGGVSGSSPAVIMATSDGGGTWVQQDASAAGANAELVSVSFADRDHGLAIGDKTDDTGGYMGKVVLATSNGGRTWSVRKTPSRGGEGWQYPDGNARLLSVAFGDAKHAWAVGYHTLGRGSSPSSLILATKDGGKSWREQDAGSDAGLGSVDFVDAAHGWAAGTRGDLNGDPVDSVILATTDGGASWDQQPVNGGESIGLNSIHFADATHGWAVGYRPSGDGTRAAYSAVILATSDGGASWQEQDATGAGADVQLTSVVFLDQMHGWAVGNRINSDGIGSQAVIVATADGGATWTSEDASSAGSNAELLSVTSAPGGRAWTIGKGGSAPMEYSGSVVLTFSK